MNAHRLLSRLHGSEFAKFVIVTAAILVPVAVAEAIITGDWGFPLLVAFFIGMMLIRLVFFAAFLGPLIAAIFIVWTSYSLLLKRSKKENDKTPSEEQQSRPSSTR